MNQRLTNGAALMGGPSALTAPQAPVGPTGADLMNGMPQGAQDQTQGGLDQALSMILQAAQEAGFQMPQGNVSPEQLPQVYQAILAAAAQSPMGQSPEGQAMIQQVAQALGMDGGGQAAPAPGQGMPPPGQGMPPGQAY
jgi:hypothetical protein